MGKMAKLIEEALAGKEQKEIIVQRTTAGAAGDPEFGGAGMDMAGEGSDEKTGVVKGATEAIKKGAESAKEAVISAAKSAKEAVAEHPRIAAGAGMAAGALGAGLAAKKYLDAKKNK